MPAWQPHRGETTARLTVNRTTNKRSPALTPRRSCRDKERVARRVGENIQRLSGVSGAVQQHAGPEVLGPPAVPLQVVDGGHTEVQVHLLGNVVRRPGRPGQLRNLLEGEHAVAVTVDQDEPVRVVVGRVQRGVHQHGIGRHRRRPSCGVSGRAIHHAVLVARGSHRL